MTTKNGEDQSAEKMGKPAHMSTWSREYKYLLIERELICLSERKEHRSFRLIDKYKSALLGQIRHSIGQNTEYARKYLRVSAIISPLPMLVAAHDSVMHTSVQNSGSYDIDTIFCAAMTVLSITCASIGVKCRISLRKDNEDLKKVEAI